MGQMVLPIFSPGVKEITSLLGYENRDGCIYYFLGQVPLFSHDVDDIQSFRYITSQLHISGHVTQRQIINAFGVPPITVKRSVKKLREEGISGFGKKVLLRSARVMDEEMLSKIQAMLDDAKSVPDIATALDLRAGTINKAIREGKLTRVKKND